MKRAAVDVPPTDNGRLMKQARQHLLDPSSLTSNSAASDPFAPENELSLDDFIRALKPESSTLPLERFISVVVQMGWIKMPKFSFAVTNNGSTTSIEVAYAGSDDAPKIGSALRLSLRGAEVETFKIGSTVRYRLRYTNGILMCEKDKSGQVRTVDLFPKEDWFPTPSDAANSTDMEVDIADVDSKPAPPPETSAGSRPSGVSALPTPSVTPPLPPPKTSRAEKASAQPQTAPKNAAAGPSSKDPAPKPQRRGEPRDRSKKDRHDNKNAPQQSKESNPIQAPNENTEPPPPKLGKNAKKAVKRGEKNGERAAALALEAGYKCTHGGGTYTALDKLTQNLKYSVVGIVVERGLVEQTSKGDFKVQIEIVDPSFRQRSVLTSVVCFAKQNSTVPLPEIGSAILLRLIKFKEYYNRAQGTGYSEDPWIALVYDPSMPQKIQPQYNAENPWKPSEDDLRYLKALADWWKFSEAELTPKIRDLLGSKPAKLGRVSLGLPPAQSASNAPSTVNAAPTTTNKLCLIRDFVPAKYYDVVVEFVSVDLNRYPASAEVTDYTRHPQAFPASRDFSYPGRVLKIALWDKHGDAAGSIDVTKPHKLENVHLQLDNNGYLEGHMRNYAGVSLKPLHKDNKDVQMLLSRKAKVNIDSEYNDWPPIEGSVATSRTPIAEQPQPQTSGSAVPTKYNPLTSKLVVNNFPSEDFSPFSDIAGLKVFPRKFRVAARIMDYFPQELREWVHRVCTKCKKTIELPLQYCTECADFDGEHRQLSYRFFLVLRDDAGMEMVASMSGDYAARFLASHPVQDLDDSEHYEKFKRYVTPILSGRDSENDEVPGPLLDVCVAAWESEKGALYMMYGCVLKSAEEP